MPLDRQKEEKEGRTWKLKVPGVWCPRIWAAQSCSWKHNWLMAQPLPLWSHLCIDAKTTLSSWPPPSQWHAGSHYSLIPLGCRIFLVSHVGPRIPVGLTRPFLELCCSLRLSVHSFFLPCLSVHIVVWRMTSPLLLLLPSNKSFVFLILSWCLLLADPNSCQERGQNVCIIKINVSCLKDNPSNLKVQNGC